MARLSVLILTLLFGATSHLPAAELFISGNLNHLSGTQVGDGGVSTNANVVMIATEDSLFLDQYAGVTGTMDQRGSFAGWLRTGRDPRVVQYAPAKVLGTMGAFFKGTFTNLGPQVPFTVGIGPWYLYLNDGGTLPGQELLAELIISVRVNGAEQIDGVFAITGQGQSLTPATFRVQSEDGSIPRGEFRIHEYQIYLPPVFTNGVMIPCPTPDCIARHVYGASYTIPKYLTTLNLTGMTNGQTFTVDYDVVMDVTGYDVETMAAVDTRARNSGPDANTPDYGILMRYADFGRLIQIDEPQMTTNGFVLGITCEADMYYILLRQLGLGSSATPVAVLLGTGATPPGEHCTLIDPNPPRDAANGAFYSVIGIPTNSPRDTDGDLINDVYELQHTGILNPLDGTDALEDADGDGRSNLREYLDGTNPTVPDPNPGAPSQLYPALVHQLGSSGDLETADLNNDGFADFVSLSGDSLQVVLGETNESFLPPIVTTLPATNNSYADILFARFNGDAFVDIAVVDSANRTVLVLLGQGNGRFILNQTYAASNGVQRVATGDFNGDAIADLIAVNESARTLTILSGNGDGKFQARPAVTFTSTPRDVALAHFSADTHSDLAVVLTSSQVAVLPGNGDGTFGAPQYFATGSQPIRVAAGDVNGDGFADIITANQSSDDISILLGNGNGTFQPQTRFATGDNPRGIAIVNLNSDTNLDLVISHIGFGSDYHAILLNNGAGGFNSPTRVFTANIANALLADVDRDGRLDIVSTVSAGQIVSHGLPNGKFETRQQITIPRLSPTDFELADLNTDGRLDILVANQFSNTVEVILAQSNGTFAVQSPVPIGEDVIGLVTARFDLGGTLDLAVVTTRPDFNPGSASNSLHILRGNGAGGFVPQSTYALPNPPRDVLAGDFNGDGQSDLLVLMSWFGQAQTFIGNGNGTFTPAPSFLTPGENDFPRQTCDFNGDGRTDLAVLAYENGTYSLQIFFGQTNGIPALQQILPASPGSSGLALADLDGDGWPDLLVTVYGGPAQLFHGNANGTFQNGVPHADITLVGHVVAADVTGDGHVDLVVAGLIQRGDGLGGFGPVETYWLGSADLPAQVADLNGDLLPDIVSAGDAADSVFILLHR